jgi:hypothetical protein
MQPNNNGPTASPGATPSWMKAFTPGRLALVIGLFLFALYPGVLLGSHTFFYQDFGLFTYPIAHYTHEIFWRSEVPLWNPLNNCGVPFLAQWNTSVCYPLSLTRAGTPDPVSYCVGIRGALFENSNLLEGIPKVDGFYSLPLKEEAEVFAVLNGGANLLVEPLADFLGVAQVTAPDSLFAWQSRSNSLPVVTTGQRPLFAGETETLQAIATDDFAPRREVYLPTTARAEVRATRVGDARITPTQWAAQRARFSVEASTPAMVVIAQSFHHNWRAFVDGHPARLWRANHAFQALEVPAGRHEVTLVYQDSAFHLGAIISALTLITCLVFLMPVGGPRPSFNGAALN